MILKNTNVNPSAKTETTPEPNDQKAFEQQVEVWNAELVQIAEFRKGNYAAMADPRIRHARNILEKTAVELGIDKESALTAYDVARGEIATWNYIKTLKDRETRLQKAIEDLSSRKPTRLERFASWVEKRVDA
jgi:hypothetical protein